MHISWTYLDCKYVATLRAQKSCKVSANWSCCSFHFSFSRKRRYWSCPGCRAANVSRVISLSTFYLALWTVLERCIIFTENHHSPIDASNHCGNRLPYTFNLSSNVGQCFIVGILDLARMEHDASHHQSSHQDAGAVWSSWIICVGPVVLSVCCVFTWKIFVRRHLVIAQAAVWWNMSCSNGSSSGGGCRISSSCCCSSGIIFH